jgi:putative serine protease PepD
VNQTTPADERPRRRGRRFGVAVAAVVGLLAAGAVGGVIALAVHDDSESETPTADRSACVATNVATHGLPSVVTIAVQGAGASGTGSGEVIRADGEILTNNHVISAAANGGTISVLFSDGETADAHLVGRDPQTDLAVIKVDVDRKLRVIQFGNSHALSVGEPVVALGAPLGLPNTVTAGIVSALDRSVQVPADNGSTALLVAAIQTDTAINPGNSGGALVDCDTRLVGVPTAGATVPSPIGAPSGGSIGIGFAIPSDFAKAVSDEIIETGTVQHAFFGIQVAPTVSSTDARTAHGLLVVGVTPAGPSAAAGIRPGDIITEIDGKPATSAEQLQALTLTRRSGETVRLTFERDGREQTATVTLAASP